MRGAWLQWRQLYRQWSAILGTTGLLMPFLVRCRYKAGKNSEPVRRSIGLTAIARLIVVILVVFVVRSDQSWMHRILDALLTVAAAVVVWSFGG